MAAAASGGCRCCCCCCCVYVCLCFILIFACFVGKLFQDVANPCLSPRLSCVLSWCTLSRFCFGFFAERYTLASLWQDLRSVAIAWPLSYETPEEKKAFLAAKPFTYIGSLIVRWRTAVSLFVYDVFQTAAFR